MEKISIGNPVQAKFMRGKVVLTPLGVIKALVDIAYGIAVMHAITSEKPKVVRVLRPVNGAQGEAVVIEVQDENLLGKVSSLNKEVFEKINERKFVEVAYSDLVKALEGAVKVKDDVIELALSKDGLSITAETEVVRYEAKVPIVSESKIEEEKAGLMRDMARRLLKMLKTANTRYAVAVKAYIALRPPLLVVRLEENGSYKQSVGKDKITVPYKEELLLVAITSLRP